MPRHCWQGGSAHQGLAYSSGQRIPQANVLVPAIERAGLLAGDRARLVETNLQSEAAMMWVLLVLIPGSETDYYRQPYFTRAECQRVASIIKKETFDKTYKGRNQMCA